MRQIVLDTETTGLSPKEGHKIIEIGCIEIVNRRPTKNHFHCYLNPERDVPEDSIAIHGITAEFLQDKPKFVEIVQDFMHFIRDAELIIHNADFDIGFINHELQALKQNWQPLKDYCKVTDTLKMARTLFPGQKANLDALCKRYGIDNSHREVHGALLDAELLADVYLAMTGGQTSLLGGGTQQQNVTNQQAAVVIKRLSADRPPLVVLAATALEMEAHQKRLIAIDKASGGKCLWQKMAEKLERNKEIQ
ncbi:DNA polymerase III subunit epsilon [Beggiatoa leptomitoformis]|uniref:DNA polymerase III subunit epsilon n=1 Tax=Beggiatoa leptomitoformis TaxID=288004 RepID=A0A2N9YGB6_9GAMM|nr:DNA polymerase III subunit epsilon [Beggiatoa leptomitoformis]ALG68165.1 DNA polymerase III subunit epsilon [Beggiatoa leptomitoformis]AUI69537.1 DNA polymerase III subunit epsilon [Beggiatoa leptomitoformis]